MTAFSIHARVAEQVRARPDTTAVFSPHGDLTYAEVWSLSATIAARLGRLDEDRIAVYSARRPRMVPALLGVLRGGGAAMPLDPIHPLERTATMLRDARCRTVLADGDLAKDLPGDIKVIELESVEEAADGGEPERRDGGNLALVLYTSGSTGKPKGVMLSHANVMAFLDDPGPLRHSAGEIVGHVLSTSFDAVILDVLGPLMHGAAVFLASPDAQLSVDRLAEELAVQQVTTLSLTSSLFHQLATLYPETLAAVPKVLFGGEPADAATVRAAGGPTTSFVHHYGPTETSCISTAYPVEAGGPAGDVVPIGRPLDSVELRILDSELRHTPPGEVGDIYIGGPQVSRGFLDRPRMTAERYVPDPYGAPGGVLYRTGDRGRALPDGNIEFHGRTDHQVKIRGYRVEPAETAAAAHAAEGVRAAVARAVEDVPGSPRLVLFVEGAPDLDVERVRETLARALPYYALPSEIVVLDALPLLPNRKVDVAALPIPSRTSGPTSQNGTGPAAGGDVEAGLAEIWCDLLNLDHVGPDDDFFALGGYSLIAARLVARVESTFGVRLSLRSVFRTRTLKAQAEEIERSRTPAAEESRGPAVASPAQQDLWLLHRLKPEGADYNSSIVYRVRGRLDLDALQRAVTEIVRRHDALRYSFTTQKGRPVVTVAAPEGIDIPFARTDAHPESTWSDGDIRAWAEARREEPFDLSSPSLLRVAVLNLADGDAVLVFTIHHIVFDGWSRAMFLDELRVEYAALTAGAPKPPAQPVPRYADVVAEELRRLEGGELADQINYWTERLKDAPVSIDLPAADVAPDADDPRDDRASIAHHSLDYTLADALRRSAGTHDSTPFMLLLASLGLSLAAATGVDDVVVACPHIGRRGAAASQVIGLFADLLPVRLTIDARGTLTEYAGAVRESTLDAFMNQEVPFSRIVSAVRPPRSRSVRSPYTQIVFNMINLPNPPLELAGVRTEAVPIDMPENRVPLAIIVHERNGRYELECISDPHHVAPEFAQGVMRALPEAARLLVERPDLLTSDALDLLGRSAAMEVQTP
ncbi:non-ribosomal peptide synthetase [Actinomadura sp. 7K507]|uniref:non-ribosomal peptide synthetase n=1 Tax=Actinomadura sp. 7K507 TaxID=2530365 RepID=UPI001052FE2A|nr:non-ribosomal peptide synthetase [Actinomadura sp. 7K507]TDC86435.1 amino acid adenylation domain-containing protein [Actinomadura sp. 7K507]